MSITQAHASASLLLAFTVIPPSNVPVTFSSPYTAFKTSIFVISSNLYLKPFISYGTFLYKVNNKYYAAHQYTAGFGGRNTAGKFFTDYMLYFGQNMYLNSTYGAYSGLSKTVNPVTVFNNKAHINNYYSSGGGLGVGYYYNKFLFQLGAGCNMNYDKKLHNIQKVLYLL